MATTAVTAAMTDTDIPEPELRAELLRRRDIEQEARFAWLDARERGEDPDWEPVRVIDDDNLVFLVDMIGKHGWLGSHLVGVDGAHACWLMVQHAPLEYQDRWLPLMEQAVTEGRARPGDLAYLQDRVNMSHGRRQVYGSQPWHADRLWPLTDPANLNVRRVAVDLPPLDQDVIDNAWTAEELRDQGHPLDDSVG